MSHVVSQRIQKICLFFNIFKPWCVLLTCSDRILRDVDFGWLWMTLDDFGQSSSNPQRISCISKNCARLCGMGCWGRTPLHSAAAKGHVEVVKLLVEVAPRAVQNKWGRGPQLQSSCRSLALVLRCWLHLLASPTSRCRSSDKMLSHPIFDGFAIFSRHVLTWVSMNPIIGFFNRFSNCSGNLEKHQLLRVSFVLNKFGLSVCHLNLKHLKNSSETDRTTTDEISRNGPWWIFLNS